MVDDPDVKTNISNFFDKESKSMKDRHEDEGIPESMQQQVQAIIDAKVGTALDVGSGPGSLLLELLRGGTDKVIGLDLSADMNKVAHDRVEKEEFSDRVTLYEGSFLDLTIAEQPEAVSLHRVLCCHPDREGMLRQSVSYKPSIITLSIPREWKLFRLSVAMLGVVAKIKKSFRPYIHSQKSVDTQLLSEGYQLTSRHKGRWWITSTYEYQP